MTDLVSKSNKIPINKKQKSDGNKPTIKSEIEYSQGTSYQPNDPKTKDTATEAYVETDEVYITAEIYSLTDIPEALKKNRNAPPKPGTVVPEYCDEKCLVLRAYRDKTINTDEFFDFSEPCLSLNCIFPPDGFTEKVACYTRNDVKYCEPTKDGCVRINWSTCNDSCPNLITNQIAQTDGDGTADLIEKPGDVKDAEVKPKHKPGTPINLMTIQELEEETKVDEGTQPEVDLEEEDKEEETVGMEIEPEAAKTGAQQTDDAEAEFLKDEIIVTPLKMERAARGGPEKPSKAKYEMGTIISEQEAMIFNKSKRQIDSRRFSRESFCRSTKISESIVCCTRFVHPTTQHSTVQCNIIRSNARSSCLSMDQPIPCDYMERRTACARHFDNSRSEPKPCWSGSSEICSIDYWAKNDANHGSFQDTSIARPYCATNNGQRCSIAREPFENCAQNRSNRNNAYNQNYVNLNKGYYNSVGGYCLCNNGYNVQHANAFYCAPRNQMVYRTPTNYYHCLNTWY